MQAYANPVNWISATGRKPCAASPIDTPAMPASASGVSSTRLSPCSRSNSVGGAKHSAVNADVLAQYQYARIVFHGTPERQIDCLYQAEFRHHARPAVIPALAICSARSAGIWA